MKAVFFMLAAAGFGSPWAFADFPTDLPPSPAAPSAPVDTSAATPAAPGASASSATGTTTDPAKIADFERRFAQGKDLEAQGRLAEARTVFDGILAEAPDAKGSLREAGLISVELNDLVKADSYFSRLHALVPDYPMAIEALIQVNQTLKHDAKVEILIKKFHDLYAAGKVPEPYFVRERIHLDDGTEIVITQFFDYHQPRFYAWAGDLFDASHALKRRLTVTYDPEVTKSMRAKDPRLANAEQLLLVEDVMTGDRVTRIDVYQQFLALPEYIKMRNIMLEVFANALKPIASAPIPENTQ
jgi:tetratricopeptide (TPR) repeat protein